MTNMTYMAALITLSYHWTLEYTYKYRLVVCQTAADKAVVQVLILTADLQLCLGWQCHMTVLFSQFGTHEMPAMCIARFAQSVSTEARGSRCQQ